MVSGRTWLVAAVSLADAWRDGMGGDKRKGGMKEDEEDEEC